MLKATPAPLVCYSRCVGCGAPWDTALEPCAGCGRQGVPENTDQNPYLPLREFDLVVIPCGSAKAAAPAPAAELYRGTYFRLCLEYARCQVPDEQIRILSGKHGLVQLAQTLEPYNLKLGSRDSIGSITVKNQAREQGIDSAARVLALGGWEYRRVVQRIWPQAELPFTELRGIGYQQRWLRAAIHNAEHGLRNWLVAPNARGDLREWKAGEAVIVASVPHGPEQLVGHADTIRCLTASRTVRQPAPQYRVILTGVSWCHTHQLLHLDDWRRERAELATRSQEAHDGVFA